MDKRDLFYMVLIVMTLGVGLMCGDQIGTNRQYLKDKASMLKLADVVGNAHSNTPGVYQTMPRESKR